MNEAIEKAVDFFGSQQKLGEAVGVTQGAVKKWLKGGGISVIYAKKIEEATNGQVTMRQVAEGVRD